MNSDRLRFQSWIEQQIGCRDLSKWESYKEKLIAFVVDKSHIDSARAELGKDAVSLFTKALISCCSGIQDASNQHTGWGLVKLYYSLFYSSRANLCARQQGLARNRSWVRFDLTAINSPCIKLLKKYRNDHEVALYVYSDLYGASDPLLTNNIEGQPPYEWMMDTRNIVNYRISHFSDPLFPTHIQSAMKVYAPGSIKSILDSYMDDTGNILSFQPEHAWLAIPFKQVLKCREEIRLKNLISDISVVQLDHLEALPAILPARAIAALNLRSFLFPSSET